MKALLSALILSAVAAPVLAAQAPVSTVPEAGVTVQAPSPDGLDRRSGLCREGSTCGGV